MTNISRRVFFDFTGIPYAAADCIDLMIEVQKRIFERNIELPNDRNEMRRHAYGLLRTHVDRVEKPEPGDLVMMRDFLQRYPAHVGTYFELSGDGWVLHTTERTDSVFHRIREISNLSIIIEGYYRWKTA